MTWFDDSKILVPFVPSFRLLNISLSLTLYSKSPAEFPLTDQGGEVLCLWPIEHAYDKYSC